MVLPHTVAVAIYESNNGEGAHDTARIPTVSASYLSIGDPRPLGPGASTIPSATEMSKLSRALKRLKGKLKQTKDESAPSRSSAAVVATPQPPQSDAKPSSGVHKTPPTQLLAQGSHGLNSASKVTTPTVRKPASLSRETQQADLPCELVLQSTRAAPSARRISGPVSTFAEVALQPDPQPALVESPKETPQSEPQRELLDAEEVEDQSVVPNAPEKLAQQLCPLGNTPAVNPLPQPAPRPTITAPKAKRQAPKPAVTAPRADPQPTPRATRQTPKPSIAAPKAKPQPAPRATRQTPKPAPNWVPIPRPAVQTHAGLFSGFTPSVAAVDQPAPKTLLEAQKTALDVLYGTSPFGPGVPVTIRRYGGLDDYEAANSGPSTTSSRRDFSNISYASPSPYSSAGPLGTFRTGGPLGGGQYSSTGGAIGGGTIAQTGGRFGEGSVSRTGGSLGEGLGLQGYESRDRLEKYRVVFDDDADLDDSLYD